MWAVRTSDTVHCDILVFSPEPKNDTNLLLSLLTPPRSFEEMNLQAVAHGSPTPKPGHPATRSGWEPHRPCRQPSGHFSGKYGEGHDHKIGI